MHASTTTIEAHPPRRLPARAPGRRAAGPARRWRSLAVGVVLVAAGVLQLAFSARLLWVSFAEQEATCRPLLYRDPVTGREVRRPVPSCDTPADDLR